jgi:hypothetical protein
MRSRVDGQALCRRQVYGVGAMTLTRLVLILGVGLVFVDFAFGEGRLVQSVSTQTIDLGYRLNDSFSRIVHRISP